MLKLKLPIFIIILFLFFNSHSLLASGHTDFQDELKLSVIDKPGYEMYNFYIRGFNKWHNDTANDKSCSNIPVDPYTLLTDLVQCIYDNEIKYFKRNELNFDLRFTDTIYEWYSTSFNRANTLQKKWILYGTDNYESDFEKFIKINLETEYKSMHLYLRDLFSETVMQEQLKALSKANSPNIKEDDSFIKMCKNSSLSDLDKDVALLCLEKLNK